MKSILYMLPALALVSCGEKNSSSTAAESIDVSFENYNQAETARNFNNWVKLGSDNKM